jgi:drug/metabolite transporter (DMT)-like permease
MTKIATAGDSPNAISQQNKGYIYGFIGVFIFALTLPLTRIAVAEFNPLLLSIGRTVWAALVALPLLLVTRQKWPTRSDLGKLVVVALGVIFGFPVLSALAMQSAPASHGGVVLGALPLATAAMGTIFADEKPSRIFWFWSLLASAAVITFALWDGGTTLHAADMLLVLAVIAASMGYAVSGKLARTLGGWQVICWALVIALPVTLPVTYYYSNTLTGAESPKAWACFAYLALMSQLLGFFAWNKGLAMGGVAKVGQVQLLQTFITLGFSALLLGETISLRMILFALIVGVCVWFGKNAQVRSKT